MRVAAQNQSLHIFCLWVAIAVLTGINETAFVSSKSLSGTSSVLVVGSANADTFLTVDRLPTEGENLTLLPGTEPTIDVPGGKGCTQAVAVSKLLQSSSKPSKCLFIGQFGLDEAGKMLRFSLEEAGVDCSHCGFHPNLSSGRGYVFLQAQTGSVSAVVSGGANAMGWNEWKEAWEERQTRKTPESKSDLEDKLTRIFEDEGVRCVLLQREVPEYVNLLIASCVKDHNDKNKNRSNGSTIKVFQDVGGEDRPISKEMLELCDYIIPNESELKRLVKSTSVSVPASHDAAEVAISILPYVISLQKLGATNVLVTMGASGSLILQSNGSTALWQPGRKVREVVDETGAGDCYRAAFAVALVMEGCEPEEAMRFATAAGSCSVEVNGAVPSTPSRNRIEERLKSKNTNNSKSISIPRGGDRKSASSPCANNNHNPAFMSRGGSANDGIEDATRFPFLIGSRLNSMKDRPELWKADGCRSPRDYVIRQGTIHGLTCVDFNYPQHFGSPFWTSNKEMKKALDKEGLVAGAVCLRYPSKFARGAMNHPDPKLRKEAIELTKEAAAAAIELGCDEVVIWSAYDGYDYPFQVDCK